MRIWNTRNIEEVGSLLGTSIDFRCQLCKWTEPKAGLSMTDKTKPLLVVKMAAGVSRLMLRTMERRKDNALLDTATCNWNIFASEGIVPGKGQRSEIQILQKKSVLHHKHRILQNTGKIWHRIYTLPQRIIFFRILFIFYFIHWFLSFLFHDAMRGTENKLKTNVFTYVLFNFPLWHFQLFAYNRKKNISDFLNLHS